MTATIPPCPACQSPYAYADRNMLVCPECGHEWPAGASDAGDTAVDTALVRDANGTPLQDGDTVTVIKDLKIKGSSSVVKVGTKVKNIRIVGGDHDIDCKIPGIGPMGLKSEYVRKVTSNAMLLLALFKALRDLMLPAILKIFAWCMIAYIAGFAMLVWLLGWLFDAYLPLENAEGFFAKILAGVGGTLAAWFLFPLLYPVLVSFFDEKVADIIDREDYPALPPATQPFWPTLTADILFTIKAVALNIVFLPLLLVPVLGLVFYYGLNGYLLGMQFFRMAAGRRVTPEMAAALQKKNFASIMLCGVGISFAATIPFINLAAPILGVAVMIHLFYLQQAEPDAQT